MLVECGLKKGVTGLQTVLNDLVTLSSLVYGDEEVPAASRSPPLEAGTSRRSVQSTHNGQQVKNIYVSFRSFHALSNDEKLRLLLADSTDVSLMHNLKTRALPFLQRLGQTRNTPPDRTASPDNDLLRRWMIIMAGGDRFHWCALIIQASRPIKDNPEENRIIKKPAELMRTALDVVYACPATTAYAFQQMAIIFESLPERAAGVTHIAELALHTRVDRMEKHLNTNETLLK